MRQLRKSLAIALLLQLLVFSLPGSGQTDETSQGQRPQRKRTVGQDKSSAPQELGEGETLKIGVELVQVVFSVVNDQNRLVTDLRQEDVEIYEGGQSQQIDLFQRSNALPMVLAVVI